MTKYIIQYLEQACQTSPSNTALIYENESINYQTLDKLSKQIALGLKSLEINSGENIAIYMNKSILSIAAIYAILKLGCCYVPISTDCPETRLIGIIKKCKISHVLTNVLPKESIKSAFHQNGVSSVSASELLAKNIEGELSKVVITGQEPAAILHTSGTTGTPKGAVITQQNLAVFVSWARSAFKLEAEDKLLSHAPLQFDLSFFDLFSAVSASATVVLATANDTANAARMIRLINDTGVTIWQSVPSALSLQVISKNSHKQSENMPGVRCVLFAGERMPRTTLLSITKLFPTAHFYNIYGCTETNNTFMYTLPDDVLITPDPLPIGQVLAHIKYKIVDGSGIDVLLGEKGHLMVTGETIMAGYIDLDDKGNPIYTKECCNKGYYPTQDIVSVSETGELSFHGRLDNIIKSNGYRINLMEIEDHLRDSQKFVEVAVLSEPDDLIGNRIIAIVKPKIGESCSILDLKLLCAKSMPKYAIPHRFFLSTTALPKGSSGKIDKQQLAKQWQLAVC